MVTTLADRVQATLSRYRRFLAGDEPGPMLSVCREPVYRQQLDTEAMITQACACIEEDMRSGENVLPTFIPDFGTVSLAAMWGGRRIPARDGGCIHIEPIAVTLAELEHLPEACPYEDSDFARATALFGHVCERMQTDALFVRTPDLQGPMNTLGLLVDQTELLVGLYESPDLIHHLLDRITDVTIACVRRYREAVGAERVIGNVWPWIALPDGVGMSIIQDFMPMLSPELYKHFELPRLRRIADTFGGVFIHCCGEYSQHLTTLANAGLGILGIEAHYPCTRIEDVQAALGPGPFYVPYIAPSGRDEFPTLVRWLESARDRNLNTTRLWIALAREWVSPSQLDELRNHIASLRASNAALVVNSG